MHLRALRNAASGLLALCLWAAPAAAQDAAAQAALTAQIEAKRMEIRHHTELMQGIQDPKLFQSETQKHFQMVEKMLALVLEQQKLTLQLAGAPATGAMGGMEGEDAMEMGMPPAGAPGGMAGGMEGEDAMEMGMPPAGAPGGMAGGMAGGMEGEDAMEMGMPPAGAPGGMAGGMEGEDAMEMPSAPAAGSAPPAGAAGGMGGGMMGGMGGGHEMMGMGGMKGGAASDSTPMAAASSAARRIAEREALLKQIDTHSAYLSTISDPATLARETVKHQEMLDRLLASMR